MIRSNLFIALRLSPELPARGTEKRAEIVMSITERIAALVERVRADEGALGKLSTGEALAAVLVLDRKDLLGDYTMLEAVERLGDEWFRAALAVQRSLAA
jgi:hypothetical protein